MIYKRFFFGFIILLIVLTGLSLNTGCTNSNSNLSKSESVESQSDPSDTPTIPPSSESNEINDSFTVYEGDPQSVILSLEDNHNMINEDQSNDISNAFVNEDGHLFIELSDHSVIDVGLVRETNDNHSDNAEKQYTVDFYDYDGVLICSKQVNEGEMAIAPKNPVRDGYSFVGWDRSFISVNTDLEVTAQYEPFPSAPQIIVNNAATFSGTGTIEVKLTLENNPGILGMTLQIDYYSRYFSLIKSENGTALNMLSFTKPGRFESPCKFSWDGIDISESDICDGIILTLTFEVSENIQQGVYPITLTYEEDGIIDRDLHPTDVNIKQGCIVII